MEGLVFDYFQVKKTGYFYFFYIFTNLFSPSYSTSSLLQLLLSGDGEQFKVEFPAALGSCLTYFDVGGENSGKKAESFYHAICIGLFMHARDRGCEVQSEGAAGKGRFDFSIYPPQNSNFHAVIMEFKILDKREKQTIDVVAEKGLQQISTKKYRAGLPMHVTKLLEIGIAFEGTTSEVAPAKFVKVNGIWNKQ